MRFVRGFMIALGGLLMGEGLFFANVCGFGLACGKMNAVPLALSIFLIATGYGLFRLWND